MTQKIIKYYRKTVCGVEREIIHPDNEADALDIRNLTQKLTLTPRLRFNFESLTGGSIKFEQVLPPQKGEKV